MSSVARSLERFRASLENGTTYEAQQLVKSVYHRLRSRRQLEESRELLEKAACLQLQHGQVTCATELAKLLVEAYGEDGVPADEAAAGRLFRILDSYEASSSAAAADYAAVAKAGVKWIRSAGGAPALAGQLHARVGEYAWQREGLRGLWPAVAHYCRSQDMRGFARMLAAAAKELGEGEAELLSGRALLALLNVPGRRLPELTEAARALLFELQRLGCIPLDGPMAHFLTLLIEALEKKALPLLQLLRREYAPTLQRDPGLAAELAALEARHCGGGVGPGVGGLFGGLMRSLLAAE